MHAFTATRTWSTRPGQRDLVNEDLVNRDLVNRDLVNQDLVPAKAAGLIRQEFPK